VSPLFPDRIFLLVHCEAIQDPEVNARNSAYAATAVISCASCAPSPAPLLLLLLQLLLYWYISRSLTSTATATLVHVFVAARLYPCSTLYAGLPAVSLECLERVLRTTARLIGGIPRTGHVSDYMLEVLHWLPFQQRIIFHIATLIWRCMLVLASTNLQDLCCPTLGTRGRSSLRSMERGILSVPFARTSTRQFCAFSKVGRSMWNGLLLAQRLLRGVHSDTFYSGLKTFRFSRAGIGSASE